MSAIIILAVDTQRGVIEGVIDVKTIIGDGVTPANSKAPKSGLVPVPIYPKLPARITDK